MLAGVVVDEADKPVADAGVSAATVVCEVSQENGAQSLNYITGKPAHDCFAAQTDATGHFRIENFPTNATAALTVQCPGKFMDQSQSNPAGLNSLPYGAGQGDIKLLLEPAGGIEGKIMVDDNAGRRRWRG